VAGDEFAVPIGQDRYVEAKRLDAARDLLQLPFAMKSRIARVELEPPDCHMFDAELAHTSAPLLGQLTAMFPS
jgi:hypothetical protein